MTKDDPLGALRYGALCVPGGAPVEVRRPGVHAWSFPPEMSHLGGWVFVDFREGDTRDPKEPVPGGWKVHVSVDPGRVGDAWDALLPVLADARVLAKAANAGIVDRLRTGRQAGKTVVVYAQGHPHGGNHRFWTHLLSGAETALRAAGIPPGPPVAGDLPLADSSYSHVRADKDPDGRYSREPEAFNPFGFACPFQGTRVRAEGRPVPPAGDPSDRIVRMLDFVSPGWEPVDDGFVLWADDDRSAAMTAKSLAGAGFEPAVDGEVVRLAALSADKVARRWHQAMELRRAAEVGSLVRDAMGGDAVLSVGRRADLAMPPVARIALPGPGCAEAVMGALSDVFARPPMTVRENVLSIPYGGLVHVPPKRRSGLFARITELVSVAAETPGCKAP